MPNIPNTNHVSANGDGLHHWPQDVGILAMDIYFPHQYVDQVKPASLLLNLLEKPDVVKVEKRIQFVEKIRPQ